ncbi:hypothetical protein BYT27DRAFT_7336050 [Phlegmacium glaucopus]|nr:hypothetical protein BYT27DRAFT_7336050 [Phlegmacium glaucopus]
MSTSRFRLQSTPTTPRTPLSDHHPQTANEGHLLTAYSACFTPPPSLTSILPPRPGNTTNRKRKAPTDENFMPQTSFPESPIPKKPCYSQRRSRREKLQDILKEIQAAGWTLGEFLHHVFSTKDKAGNMVHREKSHALYASRFLQGDTQYTPATILEAWYNHPDARRSKDSADGQEMYSTSTPFTQIANVRAAMSSFAVQVVEAKLVKEAQAAVLPTSGLHASLKKRSSQKLEWADIGAATLSHVSEIIQQFQPLTWHYFNAIAQPQRRGSDDHESKHRRPVSTVCTHAISSLNFTRNNEARLLPLARGIYYFSYSAPVDLMAYSSRIGEMPAYTTIYNSLKGLAEHAAEITYNHGRDKLKMGFLQMDNVQNYHRQRDQRMGRINKMNVGIAATYCELEGISVDASDLEDKRRRLSENQRSNLTVDGLLGMLDQTPKHGFLPPLETVSTLFRERATKIQPPSGPTKVHPLASSGKNETITSELKDGLVDFLSQIGQREGDYIPRLILAGGDGLTYQKMIELKRYLQFHQDPLQSFEVLEPVLSPWHTEWTDLSRIFEAHWDSLLTSDPSSLGHSAAQIGRPAPPNLKKVDYYPSSELMYLVLDMRILDCWRLHFKCENLFEHFSTLKMSGVLPKVEDLYSTAHQLHLAFSSTNGIYYALHDTSTESTSSSWAKTVPLGSTWQSPPRHESSRLFGANVMSNNGTKTKTSKKKGDEDEHAARNGRDIKGDRVLANSITFMRDALLSREMSYATAEGDAGRVYEAMKMMLFTFAGSSHSKYTSYLLETVCNLELESSPSLRHAILRSTLVNLTGREGSFTATDIMQEYFNRLIEAIAEKKGMQYDDSFLRQVISPNLHHFARIKLDLRSAVGLERRSGRHSMPHMKPEVQTLLKTYKQLELHSRRPGRVINDADRDDFVRGMGKLRGGRLRKWIFETTETRGLLSQGNAPAQIPGDSSMEVEIDDDLEEGLENPPTMGYMEVVDHQLVIHTTDTFAADVDDIILGIDASNDFDDCMDTTTPWVD